MTLTSLLQEVMTTVSNLVPDMSVYIAAGAVLSLVAFTIKRLIRAGR